MGYLFLGIAAMCIFMLLLKVFTIKGLNIPQAILMNYIVAIIIGAVSYQGEVAVNAIFGNSWWYLAVIAGMLFFFSLDIMAVSTRWAGMAVTTIASRTALVIPIIYAIIFLNEKAGVWEVVGVTTILLSLFMIFTRKADNTLDAAGRVNKAKSVIFPVLAFAAMGAITICMKSAQHILAERGNFETDYPLFQIMTFVSALLCGTIYYGIKIGKKAFVPDIKSTSGGVLVGTLNYIVTLSTLLGLNFLSTSVFYASYNIGVVIITSLLSVIVFKEKLSSLKITGIALAAASIAVLLLMS